MSVKAIKFLEAIKLIKPSKFNEVTELALGDQVVFRCFKAGVQSSSTCKTAVCEISRQEDNPC